MPTTGIFIPSLGFPSPAAWRWPTHRAPTAIPSAPADPTGSSAAPGAQAGLPWPPKHLLGSWIPLLTSQISKGRQFLSALISSDSKNCCCIHSTCHSHCQDSQYTVKGQLSSCLATSWKKISQSHKEQSSSTPFFSFKILPIVFLQTQQITPGSPKGIKLQVSLAQATTVQFITWAADTSLQTLRGSSNYLQLLVCMQSVCKWETTNLLQIRGMKMCNCGVALDLSKCPRRGLTTCSKSPRPHTSLLIRRLY